MSTLFFVDEWVIIGALVCILAVAAEIGYRLGTNQAKKNGNSETYLAHEVSALSVLALILAFSFSMTLQGFSERRHLVLEEANAIGTAALRGQLLPQPYADQANALFKEYAQGRIELFEAGIDQTRRAAALQKAELIHGKMWNVARTVLDLNRLDVGTGLFIDSVNSLIDLHEDRAITFNNHVPDAIYILIAVVGAIAFVLSGIAAGVNQARSRIPTFTMVVLVSAVVLFIADLDRPQRGLMKINNQSMLDVSRSLTGDEPRPQP